MHFVYGSTQMTDLLFIITNTSIYIYFLYHTNTDTVVSENGLIPVTHNILTLVKRQTLSCRIPYQVQGRYTEYII